MADPRVYTWGRSRHGGVGRYHRDGACAYRGNWQHDADVRERTRSAAAAMGYWPCPFCVPTAVAPGGSLALPRLAPAEMPEWEREMLGAGDGT